MRSLIFALALVLGAGLAHADATIPTQDEDGSEDHPLIKRYEGSLIVNYETKAYDELTVPLSQLKTKEDERDSSNNLVVAADDALQLEGAYTRLVYIVPEDRSPLEVLRNYQQEIKSNGGEILYECKNDACGGRLAGNDFGGNEQSLMMVLYPKDRITAPNFSNGNCATSFQGMWPATASTVRMGTEKVRSSPYRDMIACARRSGSRPPAARRIHSSPI